jgi:soluble lytic murein transglycosylase
MQRIFIRLGAGLLILIAAFQIGRGQDLAAQHRQIRAAVDLNDSAAALAKLQSLRASDPGAFALNNYDYLMARLSDRRGDQSAAAANYLSVINRGSLLRGYALWHLSQFARSTGDLVLERERLRQLLASGPGNRLFEAATMRLARSFFESADYAAAVQALRALTESGNASTARAALALTGEAYLRSDKRMEAAAVFSKLLTQMPDPTRPDDFALAAVRGLDALDAVSAKEATLAETDHLLRASVEQFNRDFDGARSHYLAVIEGHAESSNVPDALYQIGRGFYQQARYGEALKYLQRVEKDYAPSSSARDALGLEAATFIRLRRIDQAIDTYKQFIDRYPGASNPERTNLNIIDALRDAGRDDQALEWVRQTRASFQNQIGSTLALFAQAKIHLARGNWAAAITDLDELQSTSDLGGTRLPVGTSTTEVAFLRGFTLEQLGRIDEAVTVYLSIPEGRNEYYGYRANARLRALDADAGSHSVIVARLTALQAGLERQLKSGQIEAARVAAQTALRLTSDAVIRKELLGQLRRAYDASPAYRLPSFKLLNPGRQSVLTDKSLSNPPAKEAVADELLFLGLYDEGLPELAAIQPAAASQFAPPKNPDSFTSAPSIASAPQSAGDFDYTVAIYSLRGNLPYPAVRFAESVWRTVPSDYVMALAPAELNELLYPAPYRETLLKETAARSLDPRFLLSIARQESRFRSEAKSVAAARGLMQFISSTADDVAKTLGRRDFQQDDLYDPDTAIQFGAQYLSSLFKQFPSMPEAVAAAYNGGAENMARWIARSHGNDPQRYVPEIGFSQSKDYVFRVMSNYWMYQELYSDQLRRQ